MILFNRRYGNAALLGATMQLDCEIVEYDSNYRWSNCLRMYVNLARPIPRGEPDSKIKIFKSADFALALIRRQFISILVNAVPSLDIHLRQLQRIFRPGSEDMLAEWQRDLKKEWEELGKTDEERAAARPREEGFATVLWDRYEVRSGGTPDFERWTCSCPAYAQSRFMMCKHLVRLRNARLSAMPNFQRIELALYAGLRRFLTAPFWRIPGIHATEMYPGRVDAGAALAPA